MRPNRPTGKAPPLASSPGIPPGDAVTAVIVGALFVHELKPGPLLLSRTPLRRPVNRNRIRHRA